MNIKIKFHIMPWEIDYALLTFMQLKKSLYYLDSKDKIYLDSALNLSSYLIDWDQSKLPKEYFISKYESLCSLLEGIEHKPFIYNGDELYGHLDLERTLPEPEMDYYMSICPDIYFHEHSLSYMIQSAKAIQHSNFVITTQITKRWDHTWDPITHPHFLDIDYKDWDKVKAMDAIAYINNINESPNLVPHTPFKWAGWFDLYSKSYVEELVPIMDEWKGYGPWDFFGMIVCDIASRNGIPIVQYVLENQLIAEYSLGDKGFAHYYKDQIVRKEVPNQRQEMESRFPEYVDKWLTRMNLKR
jgi:hypothetical protein